MVKTSPSALRSTSTTAVRSEIVGKREPALDLLLPFLFQQKPALLVVADLEVAVLDGVDQQFGQTHDHPIRVGTGLGQKRAETHGLIGRAILEASLPGEGQRIGIRTDVTIEFLDMPPVGRGRSDHGNQDHGVDRFREIGVGSGVEPLHHLMRLGRNRQDDDRQQRQFAPGLDGAEEFHPIDPGHDPIGDDGVEGEGLGIEVLERFRTVRGSDDLHLGGLENLTQGDAQIRIILDEEDAGLLLRAGRAMDW